MTPELQQMLDFIADRVETGMATRTDAELLRAIARADEVIEHQEVTSGA